MLKEDILEIFPDISLEHIIDYENNKNRLDDLWKKINKNINNIISNMRIIFMLDIKRRIYLDNLGRKFFDGQNRELYLVLGGYEPFALIIKNEDYELCFNKGNRTYFLKREFERFKINKNNMIYFYYNNNGLKLKMNEYVHFLTKIEQEIESEMENIACYKQKIMKS